MFQTRVLRKFWCFFWLATWPLLCGFLIQTLFLMFLNHMISILVSKLLYKRKHFRKRVKIRFSLQGISLCVTCIKYIRIKSIILGIRQAWKTSQGIEKENKIMLKKSIWVWIISLFICVMWWRMREKDKYSSELWSRKICRFANLAWRNLTWMIRSLSLQAACHRENVSSLFLFVWCWRKLAWKFKLLKNVSIEMNFELSLTNEAINIT